MPLNAARATLLLVACLAAPASAQVMLDPGIKSSTTALTPDQRQKVAELVDGQADRFADADAAGIATLRGQIAIFLKDPSTKDPCRREYASEFVRAFGRFVTEDGELRLLRATNVFIIARFAPTADTLGLLLDNADPALQKDASIRTAAAAQLPFALRSGQFTGPQADAAAKRIAGIVKAEGDWVPAAHGCESIIEALRTKGLPPAQAESIAVILGGCVNDLAARTFDAANPGNAQLVNALQRTLLAIRNQTSEVSASARGKLFAAIGPTLDRVSSMKGKPPAAFDGGMLGAAFESTTNTADLLKKVRATTAK
jgi:hypothetical protein